jgi:hypothetical protein
MDDDSDRRHRGWQTAALGGGLSMISFLCFLLYGHLHATYSGPFQERAAWTVWGVSAAKDVSVVLAVVAVVLSIVSFVRGARWDGILASALAVVACLTIPLRY